MLSFKGRHRQVMSLGRYTELFFLDEATALAAGHRPCAECQRGRYNEFLRCWGEGNKALWKGEKLRAPLVDAVLQKERMGPNGEKVKWRAKLGELPVGVMVEMGEGKAGVVVEGGERPRLRPWNVKGYGNPTEAGGDTEVAVLTPRSSIKALQFGFCPKTNTAN